ncbi:MAG TPA: hypothetical protein PLH65_01845 [bacterium]|nr:hypothetical protein [bacterium]
MPIFSCVCLKCEHHFYKLYAKCSTDEKVYCPLCEGLTEIDQMGVMNEVNKNGQKKCNGGCCGACGGGSE